MKRYSTLPIMLCFLFFGCSDFPIDYNEERPHKRISSLKWSPDGKTLFADVSIPTSESQYENRLYAYNVNGERITQVPALFLEYQGLYNFYYCTDGIHVLTGYSPVLVKEIATGKTIATYDDLIIYGQAYNTDEYLVAKSSIENPYKTYRIVKITTNGIEELSSVRVLLADRYSNDASPAFASQKRVITCELDSLNNSHLVVRDSLMNVIRMIPLPDSLPGNYNYPYTLYPHISVNGENIIYSSYGNVGFILNIKDGTIDTTHDVSLNYPDIQLTSDGNTLYTVDKHGTAIISYNIDTRTSINITQIVDIKFPTLLTLSPDEKHLAYILKQSNIDDELRIIELP